MHIVEIMAEILPKESIVCGWSLGGQVAIDPALYQPLRIKQLVLVATKPFFVKRKDWLWGCNAKAFFGELNARLCWNYSSVFSPASE